MPFSRQASFDAPFQSQYNLAFARTRRTEKVFCFDVTTYTEVENQNLKPGDWFADIPIQRQTLAYYHSLWCSWSHSLSNSSAGCWSPIFLVLRLCCLYLLWKLAVSYYCTTQDTRKVCLWTIHSRLNNFRGTIFFVACHLFNFISSKSTSVGPNSLSSSSTFVPFNLTSAKFSRISSSVPSVTSSSNSFKSSQLPRHPQFYSPRHLL